MHFFLIGFILVLLCFLFAIILSIKIKYILKYNDFKRLNKFDELSTQSQISNKIILKNLHELLSIKNKRLISFDLIEKEIFVPLFKYDEFLTLTVNLPILFGLLVTFIGILITINQIPKNSITDAQYFISILNSSKVIFLGSIVGVLGTIINHWIFSSLRHQRLQYINDSMSVIRRILPPIEFEDAISENLVESSRIIASAAEKIIPFVSKISDDSTGLVNNFVNQTKSFSNEFYNRLARLQDETIQFHESSMLAFRKNSEQLSVKFNENFNIVTDKFKKSLSELESFLNNQVESNKSQLGELTDQLNDVLKASNKIHIDLNSQLNNLNSSLPDFTSILKNSTESISKFSQVADSLNKFNDETIPKLSKIVDNISNEQENFFNTIEQLNIEISKFGELKEHFQNSMSNIEVIVKSIDATRGSYENISSTFQKNINKIGQDLISAIDNLKNLYVSFNQIDTSFNDFQLSLNSLNSLIGSGVKLIPDETIDIKINNLKSILDEEITDFSNLAIAVDYQKFIDQLREFNLKTEELISLLPVSKRPFKLKLIWTKFINFINRIIERIFIK